MQARASSTKCAYCGPHPAGHVPSRAAHGSAGATRASASLSTDTTPPQPARAKHAAAACSQASRANGGGIAVVPVGSDSGPLSCLLARSSTSLGQQQSSCRPVGHVIGKGLANLAAEEDLLTLKEPIEAGKVTPVIDKTYPLSEAAEAIRYLEAGHARGKLVIRV